MTEEEKNITLPGSVFPDEKHTIVCNPSPEAETPVLSVSSSHSGAYRVCERVTDFFCTVGAEFMRAVKTLLTVCKFRFDRFTAPVVCCGYSRTILGWRL